MPKYRRKSAIVEATQWFNHGDHPAVHPVRSDLPMPAGATTIVDDEIVGFVSTVSGEQMIRPGDWVMPEPNGVSGFYPCSAAAFAQLYEPAE